LLIYKLLSKIAVLILTTRMPTVNDIIVCVLKANSFNKPA
jgi:hypothetical protein